MRSLIVSRWLLGVAALLVSLVITAVPGSVQAVPVARPLPVAQSSGDSLFPDQGNAGYDVGHYRIKINASTGRSITATTTITAYARRALSSFSLDLEGLRVSSVRVDGQRAHFTRHDAKLVVTPVRAVRGHFSAVVRYSGTPVVHTDPDGSSEGWIPMPDGSTALNEPIGAMTWFPVNNTLRDKATFTYQVTAPTSRAVAANGVLAARVRHGAATTWTWRLRQPIAPYLTMISIGDYNVYESTYTSITGRKVKVWVFGQPSLGDLTTQRALLPKVLRFQERRFGPYPFSSAGLVVHSLDVGYALETATRPFFPRPPSTGTLVHEQAHQWFGDTVTPCDWGDVWLNEGFATYAQWLWDGAHGGPSPAATFARLYADNPASSRLWSPAPAALTDPADLFSDPVYTRGAMTLQALRERVGSGDFAKILHRWTARSPQRCATTAQFVALSERVSGQRLGPLFHDWLYVAQRPTSYGSPSATRTATGQPGRLSASTAGLR